MTPGTQQYRERVGVRAECFKYVCVCVCVRERERERSDFFGGVCACSLVIWNVCRVQESVTYKI